jgi:pimeloyl-ACP methyl ester carboxylesterase
MTGTGIPEEIRLSANGLDFGALAWGPADGRPALLVHGYPDTAWTWRHLGPTLADAGFRAVAPFLRGYGPTGPAPDDSYLVADVVADLVAIRDEIGAGPETPLIGHDWGAVAVWEIASSHPDAFGPKVAMAVPPPSVLIDVWRSADSFPVGLRQLRMSWYFLLNQFGFTEALQGRMIPRLWRDWSPGYPADEDLARVFESLPDRSHRRAALKFYRDNLRGGFTALAKISPRAPVLYLHGTADGCGQVALGRFAESGLPPGSRFEAVEGAGHFLQLEDPERIADLTLEWLV